MCSIATVALLIALGADPLAEANRHLARAEAAREKKDYQAYVAEYEAALRAGADHPRLWHNLARGYALLGDARQASAALAKLADLGLYEPVAEDADFGKIKDAPAFTAVRERLEKNRAPTNHSRRFIELDDPKIRAEGISRDPVDHVYYLGSVDQNRIVIADEHGKTRSLSDPADGLSSVSGLAVDAARRELWAASGAGIFRYDLKTKKMSKKYLLPAQGAAEHVLGDVILSSAGEAFTTDSATPGIYRIAPGGERLEAIGDMDNFRSPQGLCLSPDEKVLFVADYARGVFAMDLASRKIRKLAAPKNTSVAGIDGLYFYRDRLIATQNGVHPNRVIALRLNSKYTEIERLEVLESNSPLVEEPRLGYIYGDELNYVVAPGLVAKLRLK